MNNKEIIEMADNYIAGTYARFPVCMVRGKGTSLFDADGNHYLDFVGGIAVCSLGHCHEGVAKAIEKQARTLVHVSNLYYTEPQANLAKWLINNSFADQAFFCNSGAEANEAAIKLVRKYFQDRDMHEKYRIIAMEKSFHGRTMATLSATGQAAIQKGFDPLLDGFDHVPFDDISAVLEAITPETAAVMVEPVQGEGGVRLPDKDYLKNLKEICREKGLLLVYDEVQTGMDRTGELFAYMHYNAPPDIMTLAKALANGLPMGAMLATDEVGASFTPGAHATTFGGTPLVCSAALAVTRAFEEEGILENCREMGDYLRQELYGLVKKYSFAKEVRGLGLINGIRLDVEGGPIVKKCMEKGFLINCTQGNILRFIPPLNLGTEEIDGLISCLNEIFSEMEKGVEA